MSAAELNTCELDLPLCAADAVPIAPVTTQLCVSRAIWLTGSRNSGSLVKKGAGDSGHTIKSSCPAWNCSRQTPPKRFTPLQSSR